ncbi:phosphoglycolate phosphatase 2-like [Culex quinquefasciatus]|uniref:phosphoglycolate phosphatase 2-like n=1 Tax=Culex quinquefasciatus TaxID=7176 RepID=UPI0018E3E470|nr:phosphoglycolate phosphatase 2-like [Culex quinquefasciatus]
MTKRLLDLSLEDKQCFVASFDYVLTDCDGVVWNFYGPIEGVGRAIGVLKDAGKKVVYVSNNSVRTLENYKEQVHKLGHGLAEEDLIHPAISVVRYLKSINFQGLIYAICAEPFLKLLKEAGFEVITGPNEPQPESLRLIIPVIRDKKPVKAVIVDHDFNCNHTKLLRAEMYLKSDPDCLLIGGGIDCRVSVTPNFTVLGAGYYLEMLEKSIGRKATILGKPGQPLGKQLKKQFGIEQGERALFVGDMIAQDVAFGKVAGFQTLLVLTGGASKSDLDAVSEKEYVPDFYTESFADLGRVVEEVLAVSQKHNL